MTARDRLNPARSITHPEPLSVVGPADRDHSRRDGATCRPPGAPTAALDGTDDSDDEDGKFSLSLTQIVASTAAAVTAALIGSQLGVAGTLVGAALASIVSGVGAAIYSHSLLVTRRQMKRALQLVRPADDATRLRRPLQCPAARTPPRPGTGSRCAMTT